MFKDWTPSFLIKWYIELIGCDLCEWLKYVSYVDMYLPRFTKTWGGDKQSPPTLLPQPLWVPQDFKISLACSLFYSFLTILLKGVIFLFEKKKYINASHANHIQRDKDWVLIYNIKIALIFKVYLMCKLYFKSHGDENCVNPFSISSVISQNKVLFIKTTTMKII